MSGSVSRQWTLPEGPAAAAAARQELRSAFADRADLDDILLVASELCANAVRYGRPPIVMRASTTGRALRIEVENLRADETPAMTSPRQMPDPGSPGGRGLAMVEAVADAWCWTGTGDRTCVWAQVGA